MTALLVRRELTASQDAVPTTGYTTILRSEFANSESQMGIYLKGVRVGATRTSNRRLEGHYEIDNWTRLSLPILNDEQLNIHAQLNFGEDQKLYELTGELTVKGVNLKMAGKVIEDEMQIKFLNGTEVVFQQAIPYRDEDLFAHLFSPFASMPELTPGKFWQVRMFNPLTREFETATAEVEETERLAIDNQVFPVVRVRMKSKSVEALAWVTPRGEVLKQLIPGMSLMLLREDPGKGY